MNYLGIIAALISVIAASISWQQSQTNKNKLKLDLFDRRFAVYWAAKMLIGEIYYDLTVSDEALHTFGKKTEQADFLFGNDIVAFLEETRKNALKLRSIGRQLGRAISLQDAVKADRLTEDENKVLQWAIHYDKHLPEIFRRYLDFSKIF